MDKQQEISDAVNEAEAQIKALQDFVDDLFRENKPENAEFIALLLEDIKKHHAFH